MDRVFECRATEILISHEPDYDTILELIWEDESVRKNESNHLCKMLSSALTEMIRTRIAIRFPMTARPTNEISVRFEEPGDLTNSHFSPSAMEILLRFEFDHLPASVLNRINMRLNDGELNHFEHWIMPLLIHEYVHLEQYMRSNRDHADLTFITYGIKDRQRRGKRGGYHRDFTSPEGSIRYRGERGEIGAFAISAAWEARSRCMVESAVFQDYRSFIEKIRGIGVESQTRQIERAWRRFVRKTYRAIDAYR